MAVVLTVIGHVTDWQAVSALHGQVLAEHVSAAGGTSSRLYRNVKDASQVLLVGEFPDHEAVQELLREVSAPLGLLLVGGVWDDRVWEETARDECAQTQEVIMAAESSKQVVHRWMEVLSSGNLEEADRLLAPQFVAYIGGLPAPLHGAEAWKQLFSAYQAAFPNLRVMVHDLIGEGQAVACRFTWRATHRGAFMDLPASGREVTGAGIGLFHVEGDTIVEEWIQEDTLGLLHQLGAIPAPAGAGA